MAVRAEYSRAVCIIEQHEIPNHFVLVWRESLTKDAQRSIAIALFQIAKHLIVGAVLLDNINNMFEHARLADTLRHRPGRLTRPRRPSGLLQERVTHVGDGSTCE